MKTPTQKFKSKINKIIIRLTNQGNHTTASHLYQTYFKNLKLCHYLDHTKTKEIFIQSFKHLANWYPHLTLNETLKLTLKTTRE